MTALSDATLADIPAVAQMAGLGPRFVLWRTVPGKGGAKPKKLPLQSDCKAAKSDDPSTWGTFAALAAARTKRKVDGLGVMLGDLGDGRWLVGVDLDLALSPATGRLQPWAQRIVDRLNTYAEVSPSGAGVKLFGTVERLPAALLDGDRPKGLEATPPGAAVPEGAEGCGHDKPEIGLYPHRRYFTLTGRHLDGTPDELADITEALAEIAHEVAGMVRAEADAVPSKAAPQVPPADLGSLPAELREIVEADDKLREGWATGAKLTKGRDASASGLEFSLVNHLAWRGHPDGLIEMAVRHYPHGQVGSGKLTGGNADRRLDRLLAEAAKIRERGARRQKTSAWFSELSSGENGEPYDSLGNGALILRKEPVFAGRLRFDEHRGRVVCRDLPWRSGDEWRDWVDIDDIRLADWCQQRGVRLRPGTCAEAVAAVADERRFHPVREHLDGLDWDGVPRLDTWLHTYLGVAVARGVPGEEGQAAEARNAYVRQAGRKWLVSAVARAYRPGCKADHALILEGPQGAGKSSALAALVPDPAWFADDIAVLGSKDSAQDLRGKWLIELGELSAMRRAEVERVKAFVSRAVDHYRPSYGRRSQDFPRQGVFAGTTNADAYLGDETGNRRFWPVRVGTIDLAGLRAVRDQLWGEAVVAFEAGERWWLDPAVEAAAVVQQAERRIVDPWEERLIEWATPRKEVSIDDALEQVGVPVERRDQGTANRVARILKANAWKRVQRRVGGAKVWGYERPPPPVPSVGLAETGGGKASDGAGATSATSWSGVYTGDHHHPGAGGGNGSGGDGGVPDVGLKERVVTLVAVVAARRAAGFPPPVASPLVVAPRPTLVALRPGRTTERGASCSARRVSPRPS